MLCVCALQWVHLTLSLAVSFMHDWKRAGLMQVCEACPAGRVRLRLPPWLATERQTPRAGGRCS